MIYFLDHFDSRNRVSHSNRLAFTLIELLVTISIISVILGISFPFIAGMVSSSSVQLSANSVSSGVAGARAYASRDLLFLESVKNPGTTVVQSAQDDGDGYSGAAVIFTPANELRIVENDEKAVTSGGVRLELDPSGIKNGYSDIAEVDQIQMSGRVKVLGIVRSSRFYGDGNIRLLPPPFAIVFDNRGSMSTSLGTTGVSKRANGFVYYDADGDGFYNTTTSNRVTFGGTYGDFFRGNAPKTSVGFSELPWELLEPVIGVVIFDPDDMPADVVTTSGYDPTQHGAYVGNGANGAAEVILEWANTPGVQARVLFFNRYTGINIAE